MSRIFHSMKAPSRQHDHRERRMPYDVASSSESSSIPATSLSSYSSSSSSSCESASVDAPKAKGSFTGYLLIARPASLQSLRITGSNPRATEAICTIPSKSCFRTAENGRFPSCRTASSTRLRVRARSPGGRPEISKASFQVQPAAHAVTTSQFDTSL